MVFQLIRKIKQVASDRVLQKWLVGRMLGQYHSPDAFQPHHPPFLKHRLPLLPETPSWCILPEELSDRLSETACSIPILAHQQTLDPSSLDAFFKQPSADIETNLARHRFAWLPLTPKIDAAGLYVLWRAWRDEFMDADGWAWHPYTAAERAINLLDGARRCGAPDTLDAFAQDIAAHAPKIAHQL